MLNDIHHCIMRLLYTPCADRHKISFFFLSEIKAEILNYACLKMIF
jgi:hypothetical protein